MEEWHEFKIIRWDDRNYSKLNKIASEHDLRVYPVKGGVIELLSEGGLVARLDECGHVDISVSYQNYGKLLKDIAELYGIDP
jgi:hypothetical protein